MQLPSCLNAKLLSIFSKRYASSLKLVGRAGHPLHMHIVSHFLVTFPRYSCACLQIDLLYETMLCCTAKLLHMPRLLKWMPVVQHMLALNVDCEFVTRQCTSVLA